MALNAISFLVYKISPCFALFAVLFIRYCLYTSFSSTRKNSKWHANHAVSTHRDHDSVDAVVRGITRLVFDQSLKGMHQFIESLQKDKAS